MKNKVQEFKELLRKYTVRCKVCKCVLLDGDSHTVEILRLRSPLSLDFEHYCHKCKPNYDYVDHNGKKFTHERREVK